MSRIYFPEGRKKLLFLISDIQASGEINCQLVEGRVLDSESMEFLL